MMYLQLFHNLTTGFWKAVESVKAIIEKEVVCFHLLLFSVGSS